MRDLINVFVNSCVLIKICQMVSQLVCYVFLLCFRLRGVVFNYSVCLIISSLRPQQVLFPHSGSVQIGARAKKLTTSFSPVPICAQPERGKKTLHLGDT